MQLNNFLGKVSEEDEQFMKRFNKTGMQLVLRKKVMARQQRMCEGSVQRRLNEVKLLEESKAGKTAEEIAEIDEMIAERKEFLSRLDKRVTTLGTKLTNVKNRMERMNADAEYQRKRAAGNVAGEAVKDAA